MSNWFDFLTGNVIQPSSDPGPDVIQVVLSPRQFLNPLSSMQNNSNHLTSQNGTNIHPSYLGCSNFRDGNEDGVRNSNTMSAISSSVFSSHSASNASHIQTHQLRELVREKLVSEGLRLSAPPYTIPTVRHFSSDWWNIDSNILHVALRFWYLLIVSNLIFISHFKWDFVIDLNKYIKVNDRMPWLKYISKERKCWRLGSTKIS